MISMKTNVMISKEEFIKIIDRMKQVVEFQDSLAEISHKFQCGDFWDYPDLMPTCCRLMNRLFNQEEDHYGSDLDYFIDELNFGKNWKPGAVTDVDGTDLDWSTPEKFYDWVVSNEPENKKENA